MNASRTEVLDVLFRSIALAQGEFALLLARCNSREVRSELLAALRSRFGRSLYEWDVAPVKGAVNLVTGLAAAPVGTEVASIAGLEATDDLRAILAIANNGRQEFAKQLKFPLVLWVMDDVEAQLRRQAPDLASWAGAVVDFELDRSELLEILERETTGLAERAWQVGAGQGVSRELRWAEAEWRRRGEVAPGDLTARVNLAIGMDAQDEDLAEKYLGLCWQDGGNWGAVARYWWGWRLWQRAKGQRREFLDYAERAREQLQLAWEQSRRSEVAWLLGEVAISLQERSANALALAEPKSGWAAVVALAEDEDCPKAWAAGLRSELALAKQDWSLAVAEAEQALQADNNGQRQGFYLLCRGRALMGLERYQEALDYLTDARELVLAQVNADLHIRILRSLHQAYTGSGDYLRAFEVKCRREELEFQYGLRVFIGARRLPPGVGQSADAVGSRFPGRQEDLQALLERLKQHAYRLMVLYGPSGVGKSSLLQSGFVPLLRGQIIEARSIVPVVIDRYDDWQQELGKGLGIGQDEDFMGAAIAKLRANYGANQITLLIFDQFEEFFFKNPEVPQQQEFYGFLGQCLAVEVVEQVRVILSLREDYTHYLLEWERLEAGSKIANDILNKEKRYYLGNFRPGAARAALDELLAKSAAQLEGVLVDRLVGDLAAGDGEVRPIDLQVLGSQMLYGERPILTLKNYLALGEDRPQRLREMWLQEVVANCGMKENQELMQRVLVALTAEGERRPLKTFGELELEVLDEELGWVGDLEFVLGVAIGSNLVFALPGPKYQLIHDYLVPLVQRQFGVRWEQEFREERQKRRALEQEKLAESQRSNKKLFGALVGTGMVVVLAMVASGGFFWQKSIADKNALETKKTTDTLLWNELLDAEAATLEDQVSAIEQVQQGKEKIEILRNDYRRSQLRRRQAANVFREQNRFDLKSEVLSVDFAPDGQILTGSKDNTAKLWSREGELLQSFPGHTREVNSVAFSPDRQTILTGSDDKTAKLWNLKGEVLQTFSGHEKAVLSIAFSPDGQTILTGSGDDTIKLWNRAGKNLHTFLAHKHAVSGHAGTVFSVAFSPDGETILTGSADKTAKLWSLKGKNLIHTFSGHTGSVFSAAFSPDGETILTGSDDNTVKLWDLKGKIRQTFSVHTKAVTRVVFSPDGQTILTGSNDRKVKLWNLEGRILQTFSGHTDRVWGVVFARDGQTILTGSKDNTAKLWSREGKILQPFSGHTDIVSSVAFSPNGQTILTGSKDNTAKLWSLEGKILQSFPGHTDIVSSVAFSPNGQTILTGSKDNTAKLWNLKGKVLQSFSDHKDIIRSVAFAPNGQTILTGSGDRDRTAKLWDLKGKVLQTFSGHTDAVRSVAFSPNGQTILTGSWDNTSKLWNMKGEVLQTFSGHIDPVLSVAFAPDGQTILTGSYDKTAQIWNIDLSFSLARSCSHLQTFIKGSSALPSVPDRSSDPKSETEKLRDRAKKACRNIPPAPPKS